MERKTARPPDLTTAYWLIERPGVGGPEVFTVGAETLPVFSFPEEAEMFLRLGGFETGGWRAAVSPAGELLSRLAAYRRAGVDLVALDPSAEMVDSISDPTIALVTLSLSGFAERLVARSEERFARSQGASRGGP